ncbi:MAG: hypothetical protein GF405_05025, partial [Candidatus Eisenbacteria bacterium]|nr:hypothetical protein [Candidatus Eisenbacteria bacterium]
VHPSPDDRRASYEKALAKLQADEVVRRIWRRDHTVWSDSPDEIANRLGWLDLPESMAADVVCISTLRDELRGLGWDRAVLLGMGGSSLAPELFARTFPGDGRLTLSVLDSTDPAAVLAVDRSVDYTKTLFIVATKSGSTAETVSLFKYFYGRARDEVGEEAASHFAAITDPGSALAETADDLGFRATFLNDPDLGGRFSALSFFGLVPAGLIGVDLEGLLTRAIDASNGCGPDVPIEENPAALLGAFLGAHAMEGWNVLRLAMSPSVAGFADWVEQLLAESTGKDGRGIVPVPVVRPLEAVRKTDRWMLAEMHVEGEQQSTLRGVDWSFVPKAQLALSDPYDVGGQFFIWEMATAVAGHILGIHPFNQPNVESAKVRAREVAEAYRRDGSLPELEPAFTDGGISVFGDAADESIDELRERFSEVGVPSRSSEDSDMPYRYAAFQVYLPPTARHDELLEALWERWARTLCLPVTVSYGPRFLHSTGQLHKGDAGKGLFFQITADHAEDVPIPDDPGSKSCTLSFGTLIDAQAMGDMQALEDAGRTVVRFHLGSDVEGGLRRLAGIDAA